MFNIPNVTITQRTTGGYKVAPNEGYVLHDKNLDVEGFDESTMMPTGEIFLGYRPYPSHCGVGSNYDFSATTVIDGYTAYGSREFFARPQNEVPENQIFGGGNNDHEIMSEGENLDRN